MHAAPDIKAILRKRKRGEHVPEEEFLKAINMSDENAIRAGKLLSLVSTMGPKKMRSRPRREMDNLIGIIDDAVDVYLPIIENKGVSLAKHYAIEEAPLVADKTLLRSAYMNLISDALRHGDRKEITIGLEKKSGRYRSWVCNSGRGVDKRKLKFIFEPDFKSEESQGLGIGLKCVKQIVEMHDGEIVAESDGKSYTCFHIYLNML
jgi:signal transduction histidine kinase